MGFRRVPYGSPSRRRIIQSSDGDDGDDDDLFPPPAIETNDQRQEDAFIAPTHAEGEPNVDAEGEPNVDSATTQPSLDESEEVVQHTMVQPRVNSEVAAPTSVQPDTVDEQLEEVYEEVAVPTYV